MRGCASGGRKNSTVDTRRWALAFSDAAAVAAISAMETSWIR